MDKKYLLGIMVWSLLLAPSAVQSAPMHFPGIPVEKNQSVRAFELNRKWIVLADNKPKASENQSRSTNENQDQAAAPPTAIQENSGNSSDAEAKPLKPFKPSEEIAAEQAVDFPVDI